MARSAFPKTLGRRPLTAVQLSSDIVKTSGTQTIAGAKTLSSAVALSSTLNVTGAAVFASGVRLGSAAAQIVGFYSATGASQRAGSNQATTNIASSTDFGTQQLAVVQEIMNTLAGVGLWKGAV